MKKLITYQTPMASSSKEYAQASADAALTMLISKEKSVIGQSEPQYAVSNGWHTFTVELELEEPA